jgi:hypothetical protein
MASAESPSYQVGRCSGYGAPARASDRRPAVRAAVQAPGPRGGARAGASRQEVATPTDVIKDPFVLEFLHHGEHPALHERDVEQVIIERLETFLLELGKWFCFVGRKSG